MIAIKTVEEVYEEAFEASINAVKTDFLGSIRPIYGKTTKGKLTPIGSCVLLRIKKVPYLLTAAHVIDENQHTPLYIAGEKKLTTLFGRFRISPKPDGDREKDKYDFAVATLSPEIEEGLGNVQYIDEKDICRKVNDDNERNYTAVGYPNSRNKKIQNFNITGDKWIYTAPACPNSKIKAAYAGVSGKNHIYMIFEKKIYDVAAGEMRDSLKPIGISGGAVFDVGRHVTLESIIAPPKPRLAGVLIEYVPNQNIIIATRMSTIFKALKL